MRKKKLEIVDEASVKTILENCRVGRLGTNGADGFPYITPVNYVYWRDSVYFHCAPEGEKLENIQRDPRVCFEIDRALAYLDTACDPEKPTCAVNQFYQSVFIKGKAELVEDLEEKAGALNSLVTSHEKNAVFKNISPSTPAVALCFVVAIRIDSISAKENLAQNKSPVERDSICRYLENRNLPDDIETARLIRDRSIS